MDKIAFAQLISYLSHLTGYTFNSYQLESIAGSIDAKPEGTPKANPVSIAHMLDAMKHGRRIDAIREHRALTGLGLKESKDAIEAAMPESEASIKQRMIKELKREFEQRVPTHTLLESFDGAEHDKFMAFINDVLDKAS